MPRPRLADLNLLTLRLQAQGPQAARDLAAALRVDRSSVSRALSQPELAARIVRLGTRRGATYALRRRVRMMGDTFPVRRIDSDGRAHDWVELTTLHGGWRVTWARPDSPPEWADGMLGLGGFDGGTPFYLEAARPRGFLGRAVGRALPDALGLPVDPRDWSDDDLLVYLASEGDDLPGDLILGDGPLRRWQERRLVPPPTIAAKDRAARYPGLARAALASPLGSSVEGEQPKFLAWVASASGPEAVLVKYTDRLDTPTGRRWADLLVAEAHALAILRERGEAAAEAQVLDAGGLRFMEVRRFDRVGASGRRGVVSLQVLHDAFPGADTTRWPARAASLAERHLLAPDTVTAVRRRHLFGELIGNTDMHFGNLSFWFDDTVPFRLAPVYDMLPMAWAPVPGQATPLPSFAPPLPVPADRDLWHEVVEWACDLWARVADDARVSREFRAIAETVGDELVRRQGVA